MTGRQPREIAAGASTWTSSLVRGCADDWICGWGSTLRWHSAQQVGTAGPGAPISSEQPSAHWIGSIKIAIRATRTGSCPSQRTAPVYEMRVH